MVLALRVSSFCPSSHGLLTRPMVICTYQSWSSTYCTRQGWRKITTGTTSIEWRKANTRSIYCTRWIMGYSSRRTEEKIKRMGRENSNRPYSKRRRMASLQNYNFQITRICSTRHLFIQKTVGTSFQPGSQSRSSGVRNSSKYAQINCLRSPTISRTRLNPPLY